MAESSDNEGGQTLSAAKISSMIREMNVAEAQEEELKGEPSMPKQITPKL